MSLPSDGLPGFETVGLGYVFFRMNEGFRDEVVRRALTSRDQVSEGARAALAKSINAAVTVNGFRNAGIAPTTILQEPVASSVIHDYNLAGAVLRVWSESQQPLRDLVSDYLGKESLLDGEPDYSANTILTGRLDPRWDATIDRMIEAHTEFSEDDLILMSYYVSGRMPADDTEDSESSQTVSDQLTGTFEQMLDTLRITPYGDPMWRQVLDFAKTSVEIGNAKLVEAKEVAQLDSQVLDIPKQHADLLAFFEWDAEEKLKQRQYPWADVQAARRVITELADLLDEYAPVHPIAPVRSEEAKRGPRRAQLQKQIDDVLARFDALEVQVPPEWSPQGEEPTPDLPDIGSPQPEQQRIYDEMATLRTENERLLAENRSLESRNRDLTEQASELESDVSESRNFAEMWRRSYQNLLKSQEPAASDALPDFESVAQVVQLAQKRLADRLSFHLNSKSDTHIPFDHPRQVWDALQWLATTYYRAKAGEKGEPDFDLSLRHACGWRYTPVQADTTVGQYREYYETRVGNRKHELREHVGTGNGYHRGTVRIAFLWEADEKKVIVGYIGRHQRTHAS